jgi:hypothetical protein
MHKTAALSLGRNSTPPLPLQRATRRDKNMRLAAAVAAAAPATLRRHPLPPIAMTVQLCILQRLCRRRRHFLA